MVTEKQAVMNSANIAFWMVNVSQQLLQLSNAQSILDLKASRHGIKYAREVFKLLPKMSRQLIIQPSGKGFQLWGGSMI